MHHPTNRIVHTTAFVTPVMKHWLEWEIAQCINYEGSIQWPIAPWVDALSWNYVLQLFILWRKCWVIVPCVCVCVCICVCVCVCIRMCMCIVCLYVCVSVPEVRILTVRETASSALYLITIVQIPLRVVPPGNESTTSSLSWNINQQHKFQSNVLRNINNQNIL